MISITKRKFAAAIVVVSILGFASASAAGFLGVDVPQSSSSQRMTIVPSVPQILCITLPRLVTESLRNSRPIPRLQIVHICD